MQSMVDGLQDKPEAAQPAPRGKAVLDALRRALGNPKMTNRDVLSALGFTRPPLPNVAMLPASAAGQGSREIRVAIALKLKMKPSDLWPGRGERVLAQDDEAYEKARKKR